MMSLLKYFLISLLIHLIVLFFYSAVIFQRDFNNFYFGPGAAEQQGLTVGLGVGEISVPVDTADNGYELLGADELAVYSVPQNRPPKYPAIALRNRWQGETVLLLSINKDGQTDGITLLKSSGYKILDTEALNAARSWRFTAPRRNIQVRFPVKYVLE